MVKKRRIDPSLSVVTGPASAGPRSAVTLSYAQSLDGSIAVQRNSPLALSGPEALVLTHQLRAAHHGILVGVGTVLADDPQLTVRKVEGENPRPIVLDSRLRMPTRARLLQNGGPRPWIIATEAANPERQHRLERAGARVFRFLPDKERRVDLRQLLSSLPQLGVERLMVEGGARVITSFLSQRLVDQLVVTIAPFFVGGQRSLERLLLPGDLSSQVDSPSGARAFPRLQNIKYEQVGRDMVVWGALDWEGA